MNDVQKGVVREIANHGLWTFGLVAAVTTGSIAIDSIGPIGALAPVIMIGLLGVTGYFAVESIDRIAGGRSDTEGKSE